MLGERVLFFPGWNVIRDGQIFLVHSVGRIQMSKETFASSGGKFSRFKVVDKGADGVIRMGIMKFGVEAHGKFLYS